MTQTAARYNPNVVLRAISGYWRTNGPACPPPVARLQPRLVTMALVRARVGASPYPGRAAADRIPADRAPRHHATCHRSLQIPHQDTTRRATGYVSVCPAPDTMSYLIGFLPVASGWVAPMTRYVIGPDVAFRLASDQAVIGDGHQLVAPTLLRSQLLTLLYEAVRRGELTRKDAERRLDYVRGLRIRLLGDRVLQALPGRSPNSSGGPTRMQPSTSP